MQSDAPWSACDEVLFMAGAGARASVCSVRNGGGGTRVRVPVPDRGAPAYKAAPPCSADLATSRGEVLVETFVHDGGHGNLAHPPRDGDSVVFLNFFVINWMPYFSVFSF